MVDKKKRHQRRKARTSMPLWMKKYSDTEIPLWLNNYDDIFSDFDPRHYKERALSFDFLDEVKRGSRDKEGTIELRMFVPKKLRQEKEEFFIKKRLKNHFQKHFNMLKEERLGIIRRGSMFLAMGFVLMFFATFISFKSLDKTFLSSFLIILLEPGGWFLFWEGLYQIIFDSKVRTPDYTFYEKMAKSKIIFESGLKKAK